MKVGTWILAVGSPQATQLTLEKSLYSGPQSLHKTRALDQAMLEGTSSLTFQSLISNPFGIYPFAHKLPSN